VGLEEVLVPLLADGVVPLDDELDEPHAASASARMPAERTATPPRASLLASWVDRMVLPSESVPEQALVGG
jgi:hypothetical protein